MTKQILYNLSIVKSKFALLLFVSLLVFQNLFAQYPVSILQGDSMDVPCIPGCVTLNAVYPNMQNSSTYNVNTITYSPISFTGTTASFANDDYFSSSIPIGFTFCFFDQQYSNLCISDNGQVTFNLSYANTSSSFATQTPLPFYNNAFPDNAIFGPFIDAKLTLGGTVTYSTVGTAPSRKFVIQFNNVPYFNNGCTNTTNNNFQIILYETSNIIECHITNKNVCNSNSTNWLNYSTLGIQSSTAANYYVAPGKNASIWTATNLAWQFEPNGGANYTVSWSKLNGTFITYGDSISYCQNSANEKIVLNYQANCPAINYKDTITLHQYKPIIDSVVYLKPPCQLVPMGCITIYGSSIHPPLQYSIDGINFQASNQFCNLVANMYMATVKDAWGCIQYVSANLLPLSQLIIHTDLVLPDSCPQNTGQINIHTSGGTAPYTYVWSNGGTDSIINNLEGNITYSVTVTDANGCTSIKGIYVPQIGVPIITSSTINPTCTNPLGSIFNIPSGPFTPYSYYWNTGDTTANLINIPSGGYNVTVLGVNGCSNTLNFNILDSSLIVLNLIDSNTTCNNPNGKIQVLITGGAQPFNIYLDNLLQSTNPITNVPAGVHVIKVTDSNGCIINVLDTIAPSIAPTIVFNVAQPNCDSINGKIGVSLSNTVGNIHYLWSTGSIATQIVNLDTGIYFVTITDNNCTVSDTVHLGRTPPPHLQILTYNAPYCYGDSTGSVTLSGIGGIPTYKYSIDNINYSAVAQINKITGGNYTIHIKDASGCTRDTLVSFVQPDSLANTINGLHQLVCYDDLIDSVILQANGGKPNYNYKIDNFTSSAYNIFYNLNIGWHTVQIQDQNNCIFQSSFLVDGPPAPLQVNFINTDVPCFETNNGSLKADAIGGWGNYFYTWSNGSTSDEIIGLSPNIYNVQITDGKGCKVEASEIIKQLYCCVAIVPNVFSPNGDGKNDILYALGISELNSVRLRLYNRFGAMVFETTDLAKGWDGRYKNEDCDVGTYFYLLEFTCPFQKEKIVLKGDVTLVR